MAALFHVANPRTDSVCGVKPDASIRLLSFRELHCFSPGDDRISGDNGDHVTSLITDKAGY